MTPPKPVFSLVLSGLSIHAPGALASESAPAAAPAAAPATTLDMKVPTLKLSAVTFFNYGYTFAGEDAVKKQNAFNFERAYVNIEPVLDSTWSARITPDLARPDATGKNYVLRLKFAYIDGKRLGDSGFGVRAGMIGTPFSEVHDKAWGFRVLAKTPLDQFGVVSTADLGVSAGYSWASGEARLFILNGEGYEYVETTLGKDYALQLNQTLTEGLNLTFTTLYGTWIGGQSKFWRPKDAAGDPIPGHYDMRLATALLLTWDRGPVRAGLEGAFVRKAHEDFDAINASSVTAYVVPKVGDAGEVPVRFVRFDPNMDSDTGKDDETMHFIAGYAHRFAGQMKVVPNAQIEIHGKDDPTITGFVHLEGKL